MGFTFSDHFQPGSNTPLPIALPPRLTSWACPLPSKGRVSSGESKFLASPAICAPFVDFVSPTTYPTTPMVPKPRRRPRATLPTPCRAASEAATNLARTLIGLSGREWHVAGREWHVAARSGQIDQLA